LLPLFLSILIYSYFFSICIEEIWPAWSPHGTNSRPISLDILTCLCWCLYIFQIRIGMSFFLFLFWKIWQDLFLYNKTRKKHDILHSSICKRLCFVMVRDHN
jgi:hypothetical protein